MAPNDTFTKNKKPTIKKFSRIFAESEGDDVVIAGMSGKFPNSRNVKEYEYNLYNKIDMVDEAETRWKHFNTEIPKRCGKIQGLEKFDATFFGVHFKQAHTMDPQCRMLIEAAYEAVLDAGVHPKSLRGSRTGVYVGACLSESEKTWFYEKISAGGFGITGCSRAMMANRISYTLGLTGPSYLVDTACSSSMYALDNAFSAFRSGEIDAAIIGGANLILHPYVTLQFARLGVLATNGYCRPFDQNATGYTRSEAVNCLFLQRRRNANRIYATVLYSKTNCDGHKPEGITYPSGQMQEKLLSEFYNDLQVDPQNIGYLEAHSTGTIVGDPEECRAIDNVICSARTEPLLVGSVKSNIGHSEAASGICSLVKACLTFQNQKIPPNINFDAIRKEIPALAEGRLKVVSEVEDFHGEYIGVNSFGFGGANAHCLLRSFDKERIGVPKDDLPRLVNWSGRTEDGVNEILNFIESNPMDDEFIALLRSIQNEAIPGFVFRGFGLFEKSTEQENAVCALRDVQHYTGINRPLVWVFSGMGSQWTEMGSSLMLIPIFRDTIIKLHKVLEPKGLNLLHILTSDDPATYDNILHSFVGIAAIQIGLVDILKALNLEPDYIIGHSVGELGCAYADGGFTAEQMILAAYSRGKVSLEMDKIVGSMAAIGLGYKKIVTMLPNGIEVACHNGPDSSTISGPAEDVAAFVEVLKKQGIFAKEVPCSNIAYHSRYIAHFGPMLLKYLREICPNPKPRSSKWLSTSVPKSHWDIPESQLCSAEYHTNNLLSSVLFEETTTLLPANALTIEIAPHALLQAILRKSLPNAVHIGLTQRANKKNVQYFLAALGKLYINGVELPIGKLYPKVEFPVSRGTPGIASLIKWDHGDDWFVTKFENIKSDQKGERVFKIDLQADDEDYLTGHIIDGKILVPATCYLQFVWETLSLMKYGPVYMDMAVEFEDVRFLRATQLTAGSSVLLTVMVHYGTGNFEISDAGAVVVTGIIREVLNPPLPMELPPVEESEWPTLPTKDFYKELRLRGYHYAGAFKSVINVRGDGLCGRVKWNYNWVSFMDNLLQIYILGTDSRTLLLPTRIRKLFINGKHHLSLIHNIPAEEQAFDVKISRQYDKLVSGGIEITGLHASPVARRKAPGIPVLEKYQFITNLPTPKLSTSDAVRVCVQLALENVPTLKMKIIEVDEVGAPPIINHFLDALDDLPLITGDYMFLTKQEELSLPGIHVEDGKLSTQANCTFVIAKDIIESEEFVDKAENSLIDLGFLVTRESLEKSIESIRAPCGFHLIAIIPTDDEYVVLLQRLRKKYLGYPTVVNVSMKDTEFEWVKTTQAAITKGPVILVAQNEELNGIIGLVNCMRKEPDGNVITCVFIDDASAPPFDMELPFYKSHLKLGLAINVYRNGKWGTYRHLQLIFDDSEKPRDTYVYGNVLHRGDLSSLRWLDGPLRKDECNFRIVYASLNFRDVMLATGRLAVELYGSSRLDQECVLGFEFGGTDPNGKRIMGMVRKGGVASYFKYLSELWWEVPDNMSLQAAATIPVVYLTVYYAFFEHVDIRKGKSILIHAGTGGIGIAAIRVALAYGLEVYTTCSTPQKRKFLLDTFPQLKDSHIGNSRDTSFETMIQRETNGKGVDFVLNSLSEDKLLASVRCLGQGGHFLEIGKFDMASDNKLGLGIFLKELSFHAVLADNLFDAPKELVLRLKALMDKDLDRGIVQPLPFTVFKANELEQAFRYLAGGKHIGKVLIEVFPDEKAPFTNPVKVIPQIYFEKDEVYVIPGGLGGFGLELADWMAVRGARKLVLSSSRGLTKKYQEFRIKLWDTYGAKTYIRTDDISTREGCEKLLHFASTLGRVGGIFNLAVALRDAIFTNQTKEKFSECFAPKAIATQHLDELSRKMCPHLRHFIVFSSVSCGRGNAGQTNYGMANSIMERIIEKRAAAGLPAKAIQWGAVGEVGLVADMAEDKIDMEIGGTLQQRISSCLQELDYLLSNSDPIVASMVVAEKRMRGGKENIIETVMNIMSIRDLKSVSMGTTLAEMGMDSLMAVEIKQTLERDFELFLTPQDLRSLTFQKLQEISESREKEGGTDDVKIRLANEDKPKGLEVLFKNLGDELNSHKTLLPLVTKNSNVHGLNTVILIPGIEGVAGQIWYDLALNLNAHALVLQLQNTAYMLSIQEITDAVFNDVLQKMKKTEPFYLVAHSFGALFAIEIARRAEKLGYNGQILLIDGAPLFLNKLCCGHLGESFTDEDIQNSLFSGVLHTIFPDEPHEIIHVEFMKCNGWNAKLEKFLEYADKQNAYTKEYGAKIITAMYNRIKLASKLDLTNIEPIESPITLVRPSEVSVVDIEEDYELSKITKGKVTLKFVEGNHTTMLENPRLIQIINDSDPFLLSDRTFEDYLHK